MAEAWPRRGRSVAAARPAALRDAGPVPPRARSYPPYFAESPFDIYQKILTGVLEFPRHFDENAKELLKRLLTADKTKRIGCLKAGAEDIKKHKWFRGLNWAALYNKQMQAASVDGFVPPETLPENDTTYYDTYPVRAHPPRLSAQCPRAPSPRSRPSIAVVRRHPATRNGS